MHYTCNSGDPGLVPGLGRSPAEGKGYSLQYSGLENSMDCIVHGGHKESNTTKQLSSPRGGKAGGRAPGPPALSLCSFARSLPPAGGLVVSQSVRLQPAGPASRRGPSLGRPRLLLPLFVWRLRRRARGARAPEPPVRLGCGGARAELG